MKAGGSWVPTPSIPVAMLPGLPHPHRPSKPELALGAKCVPTGPEHTFPGQELVLDTHWPWDGSHCLLSPGAGALGARAKGNGQAQAAGSHGADLCLRLVAVMSHHPCRPHQSQRLPATCLSPSGNGKVNLTHGRLFAAARPDLTRWGLVTLHPPGGSKDRGKPQRLWSSFKS